MQLSDDIIVYLHGAVIIFYNSLTVYGEVLRAMMRVTTLLQHACNDYSELLNSEVVRRRGD
jgi:hypothetical protein